MAVFADIQWLTEQTNNPERAAWRARPDGVGLALVIVPGL